MNPFAAARQPKQPQPAAALAVATMPPRRRGAPGLALVSTALAVAGLGFALQATAQPVADEAGSSLFTVGLGAAVMPRYEGSDDSRSRALPLVSYRSGRFFAGALGGIGYDFSPRSDLSFGPLLSYRFGRDESDHARLRGLGDVDGGADIGAFVRWNLRPFFLHATVKHGISGDVTGNQVRFGAGYTTALGPADRLVLDASVDWADSELMQAFFGVNAQQAIDSGLARYDAGSGVRRVGLAAVWTHSFTPQWFGTVGLGLHRLGSVAADSPITVDRNSASASVGVGYRF